MKTSLTSTLAAALIATAAFAGTAAAQTYNDSYGSAPLRQGDAPNLDDTSVDRQSTGSIIAPTESSILNSTGANTDIDNSQDPGDYYNGVARPQ